MNEIAYIFWVSAGLKIVENSSSRLFRSHPEPISIYLAPGNKEAEDKMCKLNKLANNYLPYKINYANSQLFINPKRHRFWRSVITYYFLAVPMVLTLFDFS